MDWTGAWWYGSWCRSMNGMITIEKKAEYTVKAIK